ncbi:MAG TPA: tetratricopeptide repeat protein [Halothiobacillaceae bacterium]|nr:tetratricopeptide repeat protein [Halothiobacillaceae bacterium]
MRVFKLFYNRSARYGLSAILTIILVSGCQHTQTKPDQPAGGDETAETHSDQAQALSLSEILQKLQDGNYDDGQSALETYLEQHPNSTIANRLFEQLTADPESYLGSQHYFYTVKPNDSISAIAAEHLGDPLLFLILARYNNIDHPGRVMVGQRLRIPDNFATQATQTEQAELQSDMLPALETRTSVGLAPAQQDREFDPQEQADQIKSLIAAQQWNTALAKIARIQEEHGSEHDALLRPLKAQAKAQLWQHRGQVLLEQGQTANAIDAFATALNYQPDLEPAASTYQTLVTEKVTALHEQAIVLFRNQQLQRAITLWDEALELDPNFHPAMGYKSHAQELQRRLERLENTSSP